MTALRLLLDILLGCHCAHWSTTAGGLRCVEVRERASCELVSGWHLYAPGAPTCTERCE